MRDIDYTYRVWACEQKENDGARWGEKIFLDIPFGYGVKPWYLLRSYSLICFIFGLFYLICLREKKSNQLFVFRFNKSWFLEFFWAVFHSLDILTPGIDLQSKKIIPKACVLKEKNKVVYWGKVVQRLFGWYFLVLFLIMFSKIWVR